MKMKGMAAIIISFILLFPFLTINGNEYGISIKSIGNVLYVGGSGSNNYTSIQAAINAAENGYTIYVYPRQYNESIIINKSISLVGVVENGNKPVINGEGRNYAVAITANNCKIAQLKIINYGNFSDWPPEKQGFGIKIYSNNNVIEKNTVSCNWISIQIYSSHNIIANNSISGADSSGIESWGDNNTIIYNNVSHNQFGIGIDIGASSNNTISWNIIKHNMHGIDVWGDNNTISYNIVDNNNQYGISVEPGSYNKIFRNKICNNGRVGLLIACVMEPASWNVVSYNNISFNGLRGIYLLGNWPYLNNNTIYRNTISYNGGKGIYLYWMCKDNIIKENNFIRNKGDAGFHLFDRKCRNRWNANYWDDWKLPLPKPIFGKIWEPFPHRWLNFDFHPAMHPYKI